MTIFVTKGDAPLTSVQLEKRAQTYIKRSWPSQAREESIRKADGLFTAFMDTFSSDHVTNVANNTFNSQLQEYGIAVARLARYILADGRAEATEEQGTGEQVWNEETMEMDAVLAEVITVSAIEPLEATVTRWVYSDDMEAAPTEETIENPLITADNAERVAAQAVIDATPEAVKEV